MIAVIQRVTEASVTVAGQVVGRIGHGLAVLLAVHETDTEKDAAWMAKKIAGLRVFLQGDKHFDIDVMQAGGSVLMVSNFTVAASTRQGRRPSFDQAAKGEKGKFIFDAVVETVRSGGLSVETGEFGSDMVVRITNDGPATFILDSRVDRPLVPSPGTPGEG